MASIARVLLFISDLQIMTTYISNADTEIVWRAQYILKNCREVILSDYCSKTSDADIPCSEDIYTRIL